MNSSLDIELITPLKSQIFLLNFLNNLLTFFNNKEGHHGLNFALVRCWNGFQMTGDR